MLILQEVQDRQRDKRKRKRQDEYLSTYGRYMHVRVCEAAQEMGRGGWARQAFGMRL